MQKVIIEVGANLGTDTENFLSLGAKVYAFEPTPELNLELKNRFKTNPNYMPVPMAVDLVNGWATFNIAGSADWGCSSIHQFNPNIHNEWEGRPDFKVTDQCKVMTIRLDTFMETYGIGEVDYLWIDAQGNDFRVLQSLGDKIGNIREGRCEVAYDVNLYSDVNNNHADVKNWLESRGFAVDVRPHVHHKEADLIFVRK